ncbi:ribonuclease P/MRP 30 subunit [Acanthamoeba castellanii str. Neff]|uniref:Ribonuclease P/MRP 30 subunit n=1 Tax=Acanthamoeba castellanii (strain ATCC 30010 / Neff) TaxID=1257118 RepID=L8GX31_ACACF|nr:ribonuclease P/MRP 30 subunit [Acanthamoeba castellanii str. Neff]ELR17829.1 ribonuclease P/MRP 30 subunit [Acanthamoeba castellanii str. Neff]
MTERFFLAACATLEVDVISLDLQERLPFKLKFQTIGQALQRGIHFEITLAQPLRGRNIIFTSDALYPIHMRAPHDLVNLAALLGLTSAEGRAAMTQHTNSVLLHGETRKLQKAVLAAAPASTAAAWQLPAQPAGSEKPVKGAKRKRSTSGQDVEEATLASTQSSSDNP